MTVALTVWSGSGLKAAMPKAAPILERVKPRVVQLHAGPSALAADAWQLVAALCSLGRGRGCAVSWRPDVWLGVAGDSGFAALQGGKFTVPELRARRIDRVMSAWEAARCNLRCDAIVLNCESAWKRGVPGFRREDAEHWVDGLARRLPDWVTIAHTAYARPTSHSSYPWVGWRRCERFDPQIYWAPGSGALASRGSGLAALAAHRRSWEAAQRSVFDGNRFEPRIFYGQLHGCRSEDLSEVADEFETFAGWAIPTRVEEHGIACAQAVAEIERRGFTGVGRIARFQASMGLRPDSAIGPLTLRALGISDSRRR